MAIDVLALGASKDFTKQVALGLSDISIDNIKGIVTFTLNDGSSASWTFPTPADGKDGKDGVSIVDVEQVDSNHFRCVFSDGTYSESIKMPTSGGSGGYDDTEIRQEIARANSKANEAESIAKGRSKGYVFDTLADLDEALLDEEFVAGLLMGDNLYIRALNVPDYWWDGSDKQQLETQKVDLENIDVYSTEEKRIGTWIDGKPLYRRVVSFPNTNIPTKTATTVVTLSEDSEIKSVDGLFRITTSPSVLRSIKRYADMDGRNIKIYNDISSGTITVNGNAIVEYTKTTD